MCSLAMSLDPGGRGRQRETERDGERTAVRSQHNSLSAAAAAPAAHPGGQSPRPSIHACPRNPLGEEAVAREPHRVARPRETGDALGWVCVQRSKARKHSKKHHHRHCRRRHAGGEGCRRAEGAVPVLGEPRREAAGQGGWRCLCWRAPCVVVADTPTPPSSPRLAPPPLQLRAATRQLKKITTERVMANQGMDNKCHVRHHVAFELGLGARPPPSKVGDALLLKAACTCVLGCVCVVAGVGSCGARLRLRPGLPPLPPPLIQGGCGCSAAHRPGRGPVQLPRSRHRMLANGRLGPPSLLSLALLPFLPSFPSLQGTMVVCRSTDLEVLVHMQTEHPKSNAKVGLPAATPSPLPPAGPHLCCRVLLSPDCHFGKLYPPLRARRPLPRRADQGWKVCLFTQRVTPANPSYSLFVSITRPHPSTPPPLPLPPPFRLNLKGVPGAAV